MEILGKVRKVASSKSSKNLFQCKICDYTTSKKYNLTKHFVTAKHKRKAFGKVEKVASSKSSKSVKKSIIYYCRYCEKSFQGYSGRWKHEKKCTDNPSVLQQKLKEAKKEIESFKKEKEEQIKKYIC